MKRKQFIYIAISGLVLLSVILKGCCKPDPDYTSSTDYDPRVRLSVSSISTSSAVLEGKVQQKPYYTIIECGFDWSTTSLYTGGYNSIHNVIQSDSFGYIGFRDTLTGLFPKTTYYVDAKVYYTHHGSSAISGIGSGPRSFETLASFPVVVTSAIVEYTKNSAVVGGVVMDEGMTPLIERGLYWGLSPIPETSGTKMAMGNGSGAFSAKLTGLSPNTIYYIKAFATNNNGTGYGIENKFNTGNDTTFPKMADVDGNVYHIVTIGNQIWLAENLKTTKYNDNTAIPLATDNTLWSGLTTPAYCYYNNDAPTFKSTYGALYNWYAVNSGKLCPSGWHVPSDAEWKTLGTLLGGDNVAGGKLKEAGTPHWLSPNTGATNESGFTALPGGIRLSNGIFAHIGRFGEWWSSTEYSTNWAWLRSLDCESVYLSNLSMAQLKFCGISVRCVKN